MQEENEIENYLELDKNWKVKEYKRSYSDDKSASAECELRHNSTCGYNAFSFSFIDDNFLGIKTKFIIKAPKVFLKDITEPFIKIKINIKEEYEKWFCGDFFIDELTCSQKNTFKEFRTRAWKYEGVDDVFSAKIYTKLIELKDEEAHYRYAKFLRKQGNYTEAVKYFNIAFNAANVAIDNINKKSFDQEILDEKYNDLIQLYFQNALSYLKLENYREALSLLDGAINKMEDLGIKEMSIINIIFVFFCWLNKSSLKILKILKKLH